MDGEQTKVTNVEEEETFFERKIKPVLIYVGFIGAFICSIAYILAVLVLVRGLSLQRNLRQVIVFSIVNAIMGFAIMQFLKIQGESFAKNSPKNKKITDEFVRSKSNKKKKHSRAWFWITSVIGDLLSKVATFCIAMFCVIYVVIEGMGDYSLLGLAAVNLLMFISFGLISLVKAYDFYNHSYIPYILDKQKEE